MGPLQTRRFSRRGIASSLDIASPPGVRLFVHDEPDQAMSRHEPQALTERAFPRDPYAEWLAQRETDRDRNEQPSVRWVHGQLGALGAGAAVGQGR
jgi:hypothetical protein